MNLLHDMQTRAAIQLFALGTVLGQAMAEGLADQGLTTARAEVIWRLHQKGPMSQRQLSDALQCTPRNVTGLVDALEESGFVERRPHPTDRRAIHVTLTEAGEESARDWVSRAGHLATDLFSDLDAEELSGFVDNLEHVLFRLGAPSG